MSTEDALCPEFAHPPVAELALSVQFTPLAGLGVAHLGLLWEQWRSDYPKTEHHPPINRATETYEKGATGLLKRVSFELVSSFPVPRVWFLREDGAELLQVQQDRFVHNWRRRGDNDYPSYTKLRRNFEERLGQFAAFLANEKLGPLDIDQCEITYVDHLPLGEGVLPNAGNLGRVFTFWEKDYSDGGLGAPEQSRCNLRFVMRNDSGTPVGRIHLNAQPSVSRLDGRQIFEVQTIGRGAPMGTGTVGALAFLDRAHDAVVKLFLGVTRPELQQTWGPKP